MPQTRTVIFNYTGAEQQWTVPNGVRQVTIDCYGAEGGNGIGSNPGRGGLGGRAKASFTVTPGETLYIYVGESGQGIRHRRTFGGGGSGNAPGGGASDVRRGGNSLNHRIIVAGGGGGGGYAPTFRGGSGGGLTGTDGEGASYAGKGGGTERGGQAFGDAQNGAFGQGGDSGKNGLSGGGGGGGWYGGGGGLSDDGVNYYDAPGGGGSGYIAPEGINPYFETGVRSGHGLVIIQYEIIPPLYVRVNGQLRESESIHVRVNGQLREVDRIWMRINGQLREV